MLLFVGYDLSQENLYLNKLLENVGSLLYEEVEDKDKPVLFHITGVMSVMGEKLKLKNVSHSIFSNELL